MEAEHVFSASRFTAGNLIFPTRIQLTRERVTRIKPKWIGRTEESVPIAKIASVSIDLGLIFATIRIESTGGATPVVSTGHTRGDAKRVRDLIHQYQRERPA